MKIFVLVKEETYTEEESFSEVIAVFKNEDNVLETMRKCIYETIEELKNEGNYDIEIDRVNQACINIYYDNRIYRKTYYYESQIVL